MSVYMLELKEVTVFSLVNGFLGGRNGHNYSCLLTLGCKISVSPIMTYIVGPSAKKISTESLTLSDSPAIDELLLNH